MINSGFILSATDPLPTPSVKAEQVHGSKIALVDASHAGQTISGVDGLITGQKDLFLTIRTADCLPLSLYNPKRQIIGLIHAGWSGIKQGIHLKALSLLNSSPEDVLVNLGPSVCEHCYHRRFDLSGTVRRDLTDLGIPAANINRSSVCTCEDTRFPSHQRSFTTGEPEGRILNFISLTP